MIPEKKIYMILNRLEENPSTTNKKLLLKKYADFVEWKEYLKLSLSPQFSFNVKKIPKVKKDLFSDQYEWDDIILTLRSFSEKSGLSDQEKNKLGEMCDTPLRHDLISRLVKKNLKCGISTKLVNSVYPDLIEMVPYQRCSLIENLDRIKFPARLEMKEDGQFAYAIIKDTIKFVTRTGKLIPITNESVLEELQDLYKLYDESIVLVGELRMKDSSGAYLDRKTSNGLFNSLAQGSDIPQENIHYIIWDILFYHEYLKKQCKRPLQNRVHDLKELKIFSHLHRIIGSKVNSIEEVYEITEEWMTEGEEGSVLKDYSSTWKDHTCPLWIKIKAEKECELRITGWEYAEEGSKYDEMMGAVICESEEGKLKVRVSGFNDKERLWNWDEHIGKIITVKFNEIIDSKSKKEASLFLPRVSKKKGTFVEFRHDKNKADTFSYIKKL